MSTLASPSAKIHKLRIHPMPNRPVATVKSIRFDGYTASVGKDGRLYCDYLDDSTYLIQGPADTRLVKLLGALVKLEVIEQKDMDVHLRVCDEIEVRNDMKREAESILSNAKDLGIVIDKGEIAHLKLLTTTGRFGHPTKKDTPRVTAELEKRIAVIVAARKKAAAERRRRARERAKAVA